MEEVKLQTAFHWNCNGCGSQNFSMPEVPELSPDEAEGVYRDLHEMEDWQPLPDDWEQFAVVCVPDYVTCSHCETQYMTETEGSQDGDETI